MVARSTPVRIGLFLVVATALVAAAAAEAAVPQSLADRIREAGALSRLAAAEDAARARTLDDRGLSAIAFAKSRQRAETTLNSIVIAAIAERPALTAEIIATAVAAAPELRTSIVHNAVEAFPGFAASIRRAGGTAIAETPRRVAIEPAEPADFDEPEVVGREPISDPLEGLNRVIFTFNDGVDIFVLRPIAALYGFIAPSVVKRSIGNSFENLNAPVVLANDLLQLEFGDAATTTGRFVVNSTVGVLGLFDVAENFGLPHHPADFGQTLHSYGVGPGPYLILPLLGPSTARDGVGDVVDIFLDPLTYLLETGATVGVAASKAVVTRERLLVPLEELRATSIDYYAAVRSAFYQDRVVVLRKGLETGGADLDAMFDAVE